MQINGIEITESDVIKGILGATFFSIFMLAVIHIFLAIGGA